MSSASRVAARASAFAFAFSVLCASSSVRAEYLFELGAGWGDMGATPRVLQWQPALQGSRKDVPLYVGFRLVGTSRAYWAPYARVNYMNYWSIGGGGNALGMTFAPLGLGVYLTRAPNAFAPEDRQGRWFVTFEANLGACQFGGNLTPDGSTPEVPSPTQHRARLLEEVARSGHVTSDLLTLPQHYPGGAYSYVRLSLPLRVQAWNFMSRRIGVGFFLDVTAAEFEWSLQPGASSTPAYGYELTAGALLLLPGATS